MSRLTVSLTEREEEIIKEKVDGGDEYDSRSAFVRSCVNSYERAEQLQHRIDELERDLEERRETIAELQEEADRVDDLEAELARTEARIDELTEQLRVANSKDERMDELATYVDEERSYRKAGLFTRAKWWVTGMPDEVSG